MAETGRGHLDDRRRGIAWGQSDAFLDEHPDAYKDIDVVMDDAEDLVSIDQTPHQIGNVKGDRRRGHGSGRRLAAPSAGW